MNTTDSYKIEQAEIRGKLRPKLVYSGNTLDLGIKEAKRTMAKPDAARYKVEVWARLRVALAKEKG